MRTMPILLLAAVAAAAADCDERAISWFFPHQVGEARERSRESGRILLVKGVSFGIDHAGAACATKGRW